ncbi:hypothetical protein LINGRAHAP2_LOCUS5047 [Linum grandiflorum]
MNKLPIFTVKGTRKTIRPWSLIGAQRENCLFNFLLDYTCYVFVFRNRDLARCGD